MRLCGLPRARLRHAVRVFRVCAFALPALLLRVRLPTSRDVDLFYDLICYQRRHGQPSRQADRRSLCNDRSLLSRPCRPRAKTSKLPQVGALLQVPAGEVWPSRPHSRDYSG